MRHKVFGKKLGRDTNARKALLKNLTNDLFLHGQIKTTEAKAKFVRSEAEKIITIAKKAKLGAKRVLASRLTNKAFVRLLDEIAPGFESRTSGYTRIIKMSPRLGDRAPMAKIELLELDKSKKIIRVKTSKKLKGKVITKSAKKEVTPKAKPVKKTLPTKKRKK